MQIVNQESTFQYEARAGDILPGEAVVEVLPHVVGHREAARSPELTATLQLGERCNIEWVMHTIDDA